MSATTPFKRSPQKAYGEITSVSKTDERKALKFGLLQKPPGKAPLTQLFGKQVIEICRADGMHEIAEGFETGEDIHLEMDSLKPMPPVDDETDFAKGIREMTNKEIVQATVKQQRKLESDKREVHQQLLWSIEKHEVKELLESRRGFDEIKHDRSNCLRLFKFIMEASNYTSAQAAENTGRQTLESIKSLVLGSQGERETMNSYKLRLTHIGENLENSLINGRVAEAARASLIVRAGLTAEQSQKAVEIVIKCIFDDELKVLVMLDGADKHRYGEFVTAVQNAANLSGGNLPSTMEEVYSKSLLHIGKKHMGELTREANATTAAVAGSKPKGKPHPRDGCGNCGLLGHWKRDCTRKQIPIEECQALTKKLQEKYDARQATGGGGRGNGGGGRGSGGGGRGNGSSKSEVTSKSTAVLYWEDDDIQAAARSGASKNDA